MIISDIQRIETIAAVFLGWLASKPRSISSAGSEGLRDKTAVIDGTAAAFDVYPVMNRTLSVGEGNPMTEEGSDILLFCLVMACAVAIAAVIGWAGVIGFVIGVTMTLAAAVLANTDID